jgi:hypothetical protein
MRFAFFFHADMIGRAFRRVRRMEMAADLLPNGHAGCASRKTRAATGGRGMPKGPRERGVVAWRATFSK